MSVNNNILNISIYHDLTVTPKKTEENIHKNRHHDIVLHYTNIRPFSIMLLLKSPDNTTLLVTPKSGYRSRCFKVVVYSVLQYYT